MIADLKPYPEYKESGQEWLGDVPKHWELSPGHAAFDKRKIPNRGLKENTVLSLSYGRIKVKPTDKQHGLVPESYETYQIVDEGNIIIRGTDLQNDHTSLRIGLVRNRGIISSAYLCLQCRDTVTPEYGYQILNTFDLTKAIYRYGSGLRQNLDHGEIKRLPIFLPPVSEQAAIVRFLDHWNGRLEKAIRSKRRVIALLQEQKQAIIHRAVTCGLDPNVKLKESGIPWLGEIPAHWEVRRAKYVFHEVDERSKDGTETHLAMSQKLGLVPSDMVKSALRSESYAGGKICRPGDLVLNRLKAHLGVFAIAGQLGVISPDYSVFRKIAEIDVEYFEAVLKSSACRRELRIRAKGLVEGFWRLYTDDFYDIRLPLPPVAEQKEIMKAVLEETLTLTTAIARYEREITLLREYRTRLTADVVTGKLDVRAAAAQLPEEAEEEPLPDPEIPEEETELEEVEG
jgi:type I restriction enzyme S subunit